MRVAVLSLIVFALFSCRKENRGDCFKGNGKEITQTRSLPSFSEIRINDKFETHIVQAADYRVEVKCGEHVIKNIKTAITGGTLTISNGNTCNFVRGYKRDVVITIFTPHVRYIVNDGVGAVYFDEAFKQDSIKARVASSGDFYLNGEYNYIQTSSSGNGDMYIYGSTKDLNVYTQGINFVDARNLFVRGNLTLQTLSIGDCYMNAEGTNQFNCRIENTGNVYYSGDPNLVTPIITSEATGQLLKF